MMYPFGMHFGGDLCIIYKHVKEYFHIAIDEHLLHELNVKNVIKNYVLQVAVVKSLLDIHVWAIHHIIHSVASGQHFEA